MTGVCDASVCTPVSGLPWWLSGKESACQRERRGFDPWVRMIPWRRRWRHTLVLVPGGSRGQRSLAGYSPWGHDSAAKAPQQLARPCFPVSAEGAETQQRHPGSKQPPAGARMSVSNSALQQCQGSLEKRPTLGLEEGKFQRISSLRSHRKVRKGQRAASTSQKRDPPPEGPRLEPFQQ